MAANTDGDDATERHGAAVACRDAARAAGLDFRGSYGRTEAPSPEAELMQRNMGNGAAVGDVDGDGDLDLYLLGQAGRGSRFYRNVSRPGRPRFREATRRVGLTREGHDRVAHFADLDGDHHLDLVVVSDRDPDGRLPGAGIYRNRGDGTFEDVTAGSGFEPVGMIVGGASLADADGDGLLDIYVSYWTRELGRPRGTREAIGELPGENRLYRNLGGFRFEDVTFEAGLSGVRMDTFSSVFGDLDRDGDADLYLAIDHRADRLYLNDGGRFRDSSAATGVEHVGNDMGIAVADLDGDGAPDLYLTNISDPWGVFGTGPGGSVLLEGDLASDGQLRFVDVAAAAGVEDAAWGWGAAFVDLDLDRDLDLVAVGGMDEVVGDHSPPLRDARSRVFVQAGPSRFSLVRGTGCDIGGDQRALVTFDADRDGDEDLLVTQVDRPVRLLENLAQGRSVTVRLGPGSAGVGAWVTVRVGESSVGRAILAGGSYLAGPPTEAIFGLGAATSADEIRVRWSDGAETVVVDVKPGVVDIERDVASRER